MAFLGREFPQSLKMGFEIKAVTQDGICMRQPAGYDQLRPGNTVSGPVLMGLADCAAFLAILARIGPVPQAVTTHLSIDFLRRPKPGAIEATTTMLKLGKRLAIVRVDMASEDAPTVLVATASVTYSLPPASAQP